MCVFFKVLIFIALRIIFIIAKCILWISVTEQEAMVWRGAHRLMHHSLRDVLMENIEHPLLTCAQVSQS
jgi:uncharacterized protein YqfA (UPF0365 family)